MHSSFFDGGAQKWSAVYWQPYCDAQKVGRTRNQSSLPAGRADGGAASPPSREASGQSISVGGGGLQLAPFGQCSGRPIVQRSPLRLT